ncbi:MAG: tRNA 2-thiouridine(34) synthase MnmA, partial [Caldilineaceae bacterium]|nr:tRNA 2-thiouridine(34) synthase MnmA [Caldilineaceae bacterium]
FKQNVVDFFIEGYSAGLTPNPFLACNRHIRFDYLLNYARKLGADYLVTGHHARTRRLDTGEIQLLKAVDERKDQSYVLSVMGQAELRDVLFPVGDFTKPVIRQMAAQWGLPIASKHDSMDLCFIADDDYRRFLQDWASHAMQPGPIVDRAGNVLGEHAGLPSYTIGQRKGLGIGGAGVPLFVLELDSTRNALVVGRKEELGRTQLLAQHVNWTGDAAVAAGFAAQCKIRYRARPVDCRLYPAPPDADETTVAVHFAEPLYGISPGQGAVFYDGDVCLGGGIIAR